MKVVLIGPYPPPHGGVSVHVAMARTALERCGVQCSVVNLDRRAPDSGAYRKIRNSWHLLALLAGYAREGWLLHLHTNGHNWKSWLSAGACGLAGRLAPGRLLTLHSGLAPAYLREGPVWRRLLARIVCRLYQRVICVNDEIRDAIAALPVDRDRLDRLHAFLPASPRTAELPPELDAWISRRYPLLTTTVSYRPEYAVDLLLKALVKLRPRFPHLGCLILGAGEDQQEARRMTASEGLDDTVLLAGDLPHELCLALISRSDLFVRGTLRDGDSVSVREAAFLGIPVVASDVGTRPEGTLLFPAGNLKEMVSKIEAALAMAGEQRGSANGTTEAVAATRLIGIYRQAALGRKGCREMEGSALPS